MTAVCARAVALSCSPRTDLLQCMAGHEVFEVDGFVFKKRRKVAELSLQAEDCGGNADGDTAIRGRALTSEQAELKKRAEPDNLTQDQQQQAAAASLQQRNLGRVLEACEAACTVALEDCSSSTSARGGPDPEAVTSVVDAALKAWLKTMHEQLPKHFQSTGGTWFRLLLRMGPCLQIVSPSTLSSSYPLCIPSSMLFL